MLAEIRLGSVGKLAGFDLRDKYHWKGENDAIENSKDWMDTIELIITG